MIKVALSKYDVGRRIQMFTQLIRLKKSDMLEAAKVGDCSFLLIEIDCCDQVSL